MSQASGKIFIAGEDLDWTYRRCLMYALPLYTTVNISKNDSNDVVIRQNGSCQTVDNIDDFHYTGTINDYIKAALFLWNRDIGKISHITIDITSMVPISAGLGSSAALLNALFFALSDYYGIEVDVCNLGYRTEHDVIGAVVGSVDFYISQSHGMMLYDNRGDDLQISFPENFIRDLDIILLYSGKKSNTAEVNKKKMERYEAQEKDFMTYLDKTDELVDKATKAQNISELGQIITSAHNVMTRYLKNSTKEIDKMVNLCNSYGAYGSKLTGCGLGGFAYTLIAKERSSILCSELHDNGIKYMRISV